MLFYNNVAETQIQEWKWNLNLLYVPVHNSIMWLLYKGCICEENAYGAQQTDTK